MTLSENQEFLQMIRVHEGYSTVVYNCPAGYPTLGYGRNMTRADVEYQETCTVREAEDWLREDVRMVENDLDNNLPWWTELPQRAQFALADMCFNLGITKLLGFRKTLRYLRHHEFRLAAIEAQDSRWFHQVGRRGETITDMFLECEYDR